MENRLGYIFLVIVILHRVKSILKYFEVILLTKVVQMDGD